MPPSTLPASIAERSRLRGANAHAAPPLAERLGAWELVELVAEGAFSRVYRARAGAGDAARPPAYAVKRLKPELADDCVAIQLLRREARVGSAIHHPRLAPILAANVERPPYYLVMPWLSGSTLEAIISRQSSDDRPQNARNGRRPVALQPILAPLSLIHSLWFTRQIAEALAALDAAGWTHSDVKPANVMVSPDGHATLIDLGLARRPADEDHSIDRAQVGTPNYMAPELFVSMVRPDIRSDIYSLGVLLFELLTGKTTHQAEPSRAGAIPRRLTAFDLRDLPRAAPPGVAQLVQQMLAGEPLRRPQKPAEVVDALTALEIEFFADGIE